MTAYEKLEQLRIEAYRKKHGTEPHKYFRGEFRVKRPKTAAQVEKLIDEYCTYMKAECTVIYSGGRNIVTKKKASNVLGHERNLVSSTYIPGSTRSGTSDLIIGKDGRILYCEIKLKDRQSKVQKAWQERVESVGCTYVIVRSLDEFVEVFDKHFNK